MKQLNPELNPGSARVFVACLLSFAILITPIAAIAAPRARTTPIVKENSAPAERKEVKTAAAERDLAPAPVPEPAIGPVIVANLTDNRPSLDPASAKPGQTINYTVTIQNTGDQDATAVQFNNDVDVHTAYLANSGLLAMADAYNTIGDVQISVPAPGVLTNDLDISAGNNTGMTATAQTVSSTQCAACNNVTINADGSFTYDPKAGFTGADSFTYTAKNAANKTASATVQITVTGRIWFVNNNAGACVSSCDGRLSHPFQTLAAFQAVNLGGVGQPQDGDVVFLYESATAYIGPVTLRTNQKFIGQDATATLISLSGFTQPSGTDPLPTMNTGGNAVSITSLSNAINLGTGVGNANLLRGFTVGATTGAKISGSTFGTLTAGNNTTADVTLNGGGQALSLTTGAFAATSGFVSVASTSSAVGTSGILLSSVTGTVLFGPTTISGSANEGIKITGSSVAATFGTTGVTNSGTQGISISTATGNIVFGDTTVTNGIEGVSLTNNSAGTRTFGALTVTGSSAGAFIHSTGGGDVNITGIASLSCAGNAISVSAPANGDLIDFQAATSATTSGSQVTGVNWAGAAGATMQFNSLSITRSNGIALNASGGGAITVTNGAGSITSTSAGGPAIVANGIALNANFSQINSTASAPTGTSAVSLTSVTGASNFGAGALSGASGATFLVNGGTTSVTYTGNVTQATSGQPLVSISNGHNGTITFDTGTLSATDGTGVQFDNADGIYNFNTTAGSTTLAGAGDEGVDILNGSAGTFTFGRAALATSFVITSPSGIALNVDGGGTTSTANVAYHGNITQANAASMIVVKNHNTGTITFDTGTLNATSGNGIQFDNADSTTSYNFNGTTTLNGGDAGIDILTGSDGTFTFGTGTTITRGNGVSGEAFNLASSNATVTYNGAMTLGTTTGNMVAIDNHDANTINFNTGNLTKGSSTTAGITITNCGAGTINFNNPTITITMTTGKAVNLATNTGSTINFTPAGGGSGIDLTSTTATTFDATGGGTVSVTGSGNTLASTTGTALNVSATTIGASGLTFQSINSPTASANAGIILNNTGASAGLTVTGLSTTAGTGGTISNKTTNGISLITTRNISLSNMNLTSNAQTQSSTNIACGNNLVAGDTTLCTSNLFMNGVTTISLTNLSISGSNQEGISGTAVSGLTLTNSTIENNGGEDYENGLLFKNLTGTVTITNNNIRNNFSRQAHIFNDGASALTLNVTGTLFGRTVAPLVSSQQGLLMELQGTSSTNVNVGTSAFNNNGNGNGFQINAASSATVGSAGTHSSIHDSTSMTNNAAHVFANTSGSSTMFFDTMNNTVMTAAILQSIDYFANGGSLTGVIQGNVIGTTGVAASGCASALGGCDGMTIDKALTGNLSLRIQSNIIQQINTNGIALGGANTGGSINASIINNTIREPSNTAATNSQGNAMFLNIGTVNPSAFTACLNITGNTIQDTATKTWDINGSTAFMYVRARNTAIVRIPGASAGTALAAETFLEANNTFTRNFNPTYDRVLTEAITGGTFANGAACTVPLLLAEGGVSSAFRAPSALSILAFSSYAGPDYAEAGSLVTEPNTVTASLNQAQLDSIVSAAMARWSETGLTPAQIAAMRAINFDVADLSSGYLGEAANNHILIDRNAGGEGWFVDRTPQDDSEFGNVSSSTRRYTAPENAAAGHIDLLTAIEHEIGHKLGLGDSYLPKDRDNLMYGYLTVGERRSPAKGQASEAISSASAAVHHLLLGFDDQKSVAGNKSGFKGLKSGIAGEKPEVSFNHASSRRATKAATTTRSLAPMPVGCSVNPGTVCVNIGILHPGDSVQISFSVTVNNPPNLSLLPPNARVTTQGTVSGGNFVSVSTNDPDTGASNDTTDTPIDLFDVKFDTITSSLTPSAPTDPVTYTATLSIDTGVQTPPVGTVPTGSVTFRDNLVDIGTCTNVAISGAGPWTAQCTIPAGTYTGGTNHPISARFNGDGNFDQFTSGTLLTQVVQNCNAAPVVTKIADTDDGTCDADCSLREAIATACNNGTVTFDTVGVFATPQTITLTLGELSVAGNVTIDGPDAAVNHVTVSGNNISRSFNISTGKTVTIRDLTVTGGSAVSGAGIFNNHATLTLINMTISGNTAGQGAGIYNSGDTAGTASLTITNSTISGNIATTSGGGILNDGTTGGAAVLVLNNSTISGNQTNGQGGGLFVTGSSVSTTVTTTNATITNNTADFDDTSALDNGGGLFVVGSAVVTLRNTIVGGNFRGTASPVADDIQGASVDTSAASLNNLIGTGGSGGLLNGSFGNQVGVAVLGLVSLNNNGGPTQTHALLLTSPAVEAGDNTTATNAALTTDQRGTGFPRIADSADANATATVDIGAFELHPSIEDIIDQSTNEDTVKNVTFNLGDDTGTLITGAGGSVTATSSNATLVPNLLANLSFTGSAGSRTLQITPALNQSGVTTITVTVTATNGRTAVDTFDLTVIAQNDNPNITTNTGTTVNEGSSGNIIANTKLAATDVDNTAAQLTFTVGTAPTKGTLKNNGTPLSSGGTFTQVDIDSNLITYDHDGSETISDSFTFTVTDGAGGSAGPATFNITVTPQNDQPTVGNNTGTTVNEGSTANTITNTMLSITDPDNTAAQLVFTVGTAPVNGTLKKSGGALAGGGTFTQADINGSLITYDHNGTETTTDSFTFTVSDGAGGSIGTTTFNITITPVNDAPVVTTTGGNLAYTENDAATAVDTGVTVTDVDSTNLVGASVSITANFQSGQDVLSWTDNNLADNITLSGSSTAQTIILTGTDTLANYEAALRAVKYANSSDNPSTATRTVTFTADDGGGVNNTGSGTRNITVAAQNDNPTLTTNAGLTVVSGTSGTIDNTRLKVDDLDNTAIQLVFTVGTAPTNGSLKKGAVVLAGGNTFTQDDINNNLITYQNINLAALADSFTFTVSDGAGGSIALTTFNITIGPSCINNPIVTSNADSGAGSLRQAIIDACDGSNITFNMGSVVSPITLTSGELLIGKNLTITGPGANLLTISGNNTTRVLNIQSGKTVTILGLTLNNGNAGAGDGGGVLNFGTLTLTNCAVTGSTGTNGGGVTNATGATLTITGSTISGNTAPQGGGITNAGTLTLINSTISGNTGDGLSNGTGAVANLTNDTFSGNSIRGITSNPGSTTNIRNTIVVNTPGAVGDVSGTFNSQGNNLIGKGNGSAGLTNLVNNDQVGTVASPLNALLAVLGNYGGPTQTHALLPGSPAIEAANNCVTDVAHCGDATIPQLTTDQRGFGRQVNTTVDIGAFESRGFTISTTSGTPQSAAFSTAFGAPLVATVSSAFSEPVDGGQVTFTAPGAGASATFTGGVTTINAAINASGQASASATANAIVGGPYNVTAAGNGVTGTANFSLTNIKANQTINFGAIATKNFGDPDFVVSPTATSGLPVSLAAIGNCTVTSPSPGTVHITGAGSCTITASQAGDANYNPATNVPQSFTINKASQTITFNALANKTFGDPDFAVSATSTSSLPVSFAATGNCTVTSPSPGTVHITGAGSCTITASQAGDANYNPATNVPQSFTINKASQTITFNALANKTFGDPDFAVSATSTSSLPVSFAATGNCTVTSPSPGTVHITGAGSCTITASQAGDTNYNPATDVPRSFNIAKAATATAVSSNVNPSDLNQSVTFTATVTSGTGTPTGTVQFKDNGANLGAAVALNAGGVAQFTTSSLTAGTHTITADYSGATNFLLSTGTLAGGQVVKAQPTLSINDVSVTEGNSGTKVLTFTVTLSAASSLTVTTTYATANGTATAPSDYTAIASTLLTFNPGDTSKAIAVTINGDVGFEADETFVVNLSNPVNATISDNQGTGTIQNDDVVGGFISFSQANTNVNESTGIVTLTVVRANDVSQAVNVDYATDDTGSSNNCAALNTGLASQRCDYTSVFGTLKFAANETQKTIDIPINLDAYTEGPETFSVKLSNQTGGAVLAIPSTATVTISDSASPTPNAIDDTTNFVRQQYRDFLNREADPAGLAFWTDNINKCNDPARRPAGQTVAQCIEVQRILTSAAFFLSIEFQETGGMVREFYVAALDRPLTNNMPGFVEFMRDTQAIQKGVVVGQGNWQQVLDANRIAFMNEFVVRPEFVALYPTSDTPTQYVDKLYQHANVAPVTVQERLDTILEFGGAPTAADPGARGRALLRIIRNGNFRAREANRTFVQIEYFGYLRRNPNDPPDGNFTGYNFWVAKLNQFNGDFLQAEMVKAFLSCLEYRSRFGP